MNISENNFSKCFGIKKVLDEKWFNRFTYESCKNIYDVEFEVNTTNVKYFQNMKECEKNKYHALIEQHYAEDINKTMGVK